MRASVAGAAAAAVAVVALGLCGGRSRRLISREGGRGGNLRRLRPWEGGSRLLRGCGDEKE
jgi:hypothetical protein